MYNMCTDIKDESVDEAYDTLMIEERYSDEHQHDDTTLPTQQSLLQDEGSM